ncbi:hypothetical protein F5887DRAFT_913317 [Amanita rubescens]|nr:hypothetical protein F5887DRAFT_913317 [Amanita rubescens]
MDTSSHQRFVYDIFRNTWLDFYYWEQEDYHRTLDALGSPIIINKPTVLPQWIRPRAGLVHEIQDTPNVRESSLLQTEAVVSKLPSDEIEVTEYQMTDGVATRLQADFAFTSVALRMPQAIFPSPQYEACTPLEQNIYLGDDSSDMPFLPFADDPSFSDWKSHSDEHKTLSWQNMIRDPNLEAIVTTTWNSCIHHGLTPEIVAEVLSGMLPEPKVLKHKRDFCTWNHPLLGPIKPSNTALGGTVMTQDFFVDIATMAWTEEKENQIADLLSFLPDTTPCYLAKICRKPCMETTPDDNPAGEEFVPTIFTMLDEKNWQPVSPCSHEGPCTEQIIAWHILQACAVGRAANALKQPGHSNTCGNVQIQMGQAKRTSVRQSQWGFGLFMEESVQKDELIDDSAYAGNATRYINHSDIPNCEAKNMLLQSCLSTVYKGLE